MSYNTQLLELRKRIEDSSRHQDRASKKMLLELIHICRAMALDLESQSGQQD